jgi:hypothetical protein
VTAVRFHAVPAGVHFPFPWLIFAFKGGDRSEVFMDNRTRNVFTLIRRDFSRRTLTHDRKRPLPFT